MRRSDSVSRASIHPIPFPPRFAWDCRDARTQRIHRELELFNPQTNYLPLSWCRLRVTFGPCDRLLHYVEPFQFIDSPEWYMAQHPMPDGAKISSPQVYNCQSHSSVITWRRCERASHPASISVCLRGIIIAFRTGDLASEKGLLHFRNTCILNAFSG